MCDVDERLALLGGDIARRIDDQFVGAVLGNPWFYAGLVLVLVLERLAPARPLQPTRAAGVRHDVLWALLGFPLGVAVIGALLFTLREIYRAHLEFLTIRQVQEWPWAARLALALVVTDFAKWFTHLARHKVPLLWRFHAVHHAPRELNFFSDFRIHPGDHAADILIRTLPVLMIDQSFATLAALEALRQWQARFYHANIRTNLGVLRYVLVTPQSHRVHHSIEARHADTNFGAMLSIWDRLFGTQYRGYDEYPATGLGDERVADEPAAGWGNALRAFGAQMLYPWRASAVRRSGSAAARA